jgi:chitooligosaccharide deacetylase
MLGVFLATVLALFTLFHTAPFPSGFDGSAGECSVWRMPASAGPPTVYLTYDDGPNPEATDGVLDVLAATGARATFFVIDDHVNDETAPLVRRMFSEGHAVAVHSNERWLAFSTPDAIAARVSQAAERIARAGGSQPCRAFRPHAGWRSPMMFAALERLGYRLFGWGWNAWDWNFFKKRTADSVVNRIASRVSDGLIVVIHDGDHANPRPDRRYAVDATRALVPALRSRGFEFGTLCRAGN